MHMLTWLGTCTGDVVAIGDGRVGGKTQDFSLAVGDTILYSKFGIGATDISVQEELHVLIREDDVIGTLLTRALWLVDCAGEGGGGADAGRHHAAGGRAREADRGDGGACGPRQAREGRQPQAAHGGFASSLVWQWVAAIQVSGEGKQCSTRHALTCIPWPSSTTA